MEEQLARFVVETCSHPPGSLKRRQNFNRLVRAILDSGKLWRENTPYYADALQQTWLYLCRNLCQGTTGAKYDPHKSQVTTWLNQYLKRRLQDFYLAAIRPEKQRVYSTAFQIDPSFNEIDNLPAPPDIPPILEETRQWVLADANRELGRIHIKSRPDLTCQVLILRRLPPETDWKTLERDLDCSYSTLANFYQRQCLPRLRKFGKDRGYL
ncbi:sigma-70 family RNA polymerase sigma factor [Oscillatoriales cyanobacterium LEGE 11467]|uniref:Sigma-70 family RNA polymerase sigma factor n=1 Tax=Zarconia navalis LEGE 11467 TaxID=1828826 RepID=A0A928Z8J1_9CYAN|nr:sigma-70 family RNA polymerase sigma factor [Zarconia navalis LEGE 11467]